MIIALAGNPNSGKTTMFNALTGSQEKVGNWAGVTVDKKSHPIKKSLCGGADITAVDLPGTYSMTPFTSEEGVTSDYIKNEKPDAIINIVDATNLSRSLFFTTQLLELGIPVVVALNKADINKKKETKIDSERLSELLGCPVIDTVSISAKGLEDVVKKATESVGKTQSAPFVQAESDITDKELAERADRERFAFVNKIVSEVEARKINTNEKNKQDKIDDILINKWLGIPIFAAVMFLVFWISQAGPGVWLAEGYTFNAGESNEYHVWGLVNVIDWFGEAVSGWLENAPAFLSSLIVDGIIGGVGAVVGFLPLVMVMYFLIALLEDCGYMARVSVVLDPIFKKVGLSGKSVIPFVIGVGCAIPGVMASRTIRNERERRATAMLAPFMPCGAKLPVIALFSRFFAEKWWVAPLMYFMGIVIIFFGALLVNLVTGQRRKKSYFIIELPEYKAPSIWGAVKSMLQRGWSYVVKAGTIILVCNAVVHLMSSFTWTFSLAAEDASDSILATIATPFGYLFAPVFGVIAVGYLWKLAAASITGFIAKENVVATLSVCFAFAINDDLEAVGGLGELSVIPSVLAISYLVFNLFTPPCFAAIGAMNSEMNSKKWLFAGIGLQFGVGFTLSFLITFFGTVFSSELSYASLWMPILGWAIVALVISVLVYLIIKNNKRQKAEANDKKGEKVAA